MNDAALVGPILNLAGLGILDGSGHVHGHRTHLGVRHQATRTEDLTQLPHHAHGIGGGNHPIKIDHTGLDLGGQILEADDIGTRRLGGSSLLALGKDRNADALAGAGGQDHGTTHDLIGFARIDTETDGDIDRLVELGRRVFLGHFQRLRHGIGFGGIDLAFDGLLTFAQGCHLKSPPP